MGAVFRMTQDQHAAYKARRAAQCAVADEIHPREQHAPPAARAAGVRAPSNTLRDAEATSVTAVADAARPRGSSKYGNVKTDGYDSKKEAARAFVLRLMQEAGEIRDLVEQARFPLRVNGVLVCTYVADFGYTLALTGERVVEDVKSSITAARSDYRIKKRLMKAVFGIDIKET